MQLRAKGKASLGSIQRSAGETSSRVVVFEHESFQEAKKRTKTQNKIQIYSTAEKSLVGKHVIQNSIIFKIPQTVTQCLVPTPAISLKCKLNGATRWWLEGLSHWPKS